MHRRPAPRTTRAWAVWTRTTPTLVEAEYVGSPYCERCGTDEFIYLETFVPANLPAGTARVSKLGEVTYFCTGCDDFSAHAVPASWAPPGLVLGLTPDGYPRHD